MRKPLINTSVLKMALVGSILSMSGVAGAEVICHWNFNTGDPSGPAGAVPFWTSPVPRSSGTTGTFTFNILNSATSELNSFGGSTLNAVGADAAGASFCPVGTSNNGNSFVVALDTTGYEDVVFSYVSQGSGAGFTTHTVEYSTDGGGMFTAAPGSPFGGRNATPFVTISSDFSAIPAVDDNPDVQFRVTISGATGAGNNRFDNVRVDGAPVGLITAHTGDGSGAVVDGVLDTDEYGTGNSFAFTGGGAGFGGVIGGGTLYFDNDATNLYLGFAQGPAGLFNNTAIFLNTRAGGFTDADMTDGGDNARRLIADLSRDVNDVFPAAMSSPPDFAIAMDTFGIGQFELAAGALTFVGAFNGSAFNTGDTQAFRETSIALADLGLTAGDTFQFFVAYGDGSNGFMSDEGIPAQSFSGGGSPGQDNLGTFTDLVWTNFHSFTTAAPAEIEVFDGPNVFADQIVNGATLDLDIVAQDVAVTLTYTVRNTGDADLTTSGFTAGGAASAGADPLDATIGGGMTDTFTINLDTSALGMQSGTVSFANNDSAENPFDFTIDFEVVAAPAPQTNGLSLDTLDVATAPITFNLFRGDGITTAPTALQLDGGVWAVTGLQDGDTVFGAGVHVGTDHGRGTTDAGVTSGGLYAFSNAGTAGNYIFGWQQTGSDLTPGAIKLRAQNNTGVDIDELTVAYDAYIFNNEPRASSFNLAFSLDDITYTPVAGGAITTPEAADGSPAWAITMVNETFSLGSVVANGAFVYVAWEVDDLSGGGGRDEMGLDNISLTPRDSASIHDWSVLND